MTKHPRNGVYIFTQNFNHINLGVLFWLNIRFLEFFKLAQRYLESIVGFFGLKWPIFLGPYSAPKFQKFTRNWEFVKMSTTLDVCGGNFLTHFGPQKVVL